MMSQDDEGLSTTAALFLEHVASIERAVCDQLGTGQSRRQALSRLLAEVRERRLPRNGKLGAGLTYNVHGAGARFTVNGQLTIDLDVDVESRAASWGIWRLERFAESAGRREDREALGHQMALLVQGGVVEIVRDGWFRASW